MITSTQEDMNHIQNILNDSRESENYIYNKYQKIIRKFLLNNYSQSNYVDDNVSEIMAKIFFNLSKYDNAKSKFNTWALNIAKNFMTDKFRTDKSRINSVIITYDVDLTDLDYKEDSDIYDEINKWRLSMAEYEMLSMKYIDGKKYTDIGKEFNLTSNNVSNKVNYLKTRIKKQVCKQNQYKNE